jgi:uncharacterized protein (TIGR03435 family)
MLQTAAVDRPVVIQTGLSGKYDFSLVRTPYQVLTGAPNPNALTPGGKADTPDVYTATQQQLGLKLEATRLPIEVLVVDKVEKPSENLPIRGGGELTILDNVYGEACQCLRHKENSAGTNS